VPKATASGRSRSSRSAPTRRRASGGKDVVRLLAAAFAEHKLAIYASAIAFRALVASIPLLLLGFGVLGALGRQDTWTKSLAPPVHSRVTRPVFDGIDYTVEKILSSGTASLIAFASLLAVWDLTIGALGIMDALNRIHDVEEWRPWWRRAVVAVGLAVETAALLIGTVLVVTVAPRLGGGGGIHVLLGLGRWLVAVCMLGLALGLIVRFGPAERPQVSWASAGSLLVIAFWIVASLIFKWWVSSVADFKSPTGSLAALLVLTTYLFTSSAIFLIGVQLDELLRKQTGGRGRGLLELGRSLLAR
jgi:membrane protein